MNDSSLQRASELLHLEGLHLDRQDWDAWVELYLPDCQYWVPAWRNEHELVTDVRREVSLIWHPSRTGLEERVLRLRSRKSVTAMPLPRTVHTTSNVLAQAQGEHAIEGNASFVVHEYDPRTMKAQMHFGRYEFLLQRSEERWRIARKKIILVNDLVPTVIDFFNL
jgi:3-phenylpropionate/cinnamic acid dioxygenase small subunit